MNPLSAAFAGAVALRNSLYDNKIFTVHKLARPVVSIGNISVGGTGKTPFVIALGELLKQRGITFDVLSRGYRRSTKAITVVDPNGPPAQFGDEPLLMARKLQVPVIVGADRYQAGLFAEQQFATRLHLLDDGFQHRRLHRDFDIVLVPAADYADTLLPVGRLREPTAALNRADAVVLFDSINQQPNNKLLWRAQRRLEIYHPAGRYIAFCGIGRPQQFFTALKAIQPEFAGEMIFPDHHHYTQRDIDDLLQLRKKVGAESFITTEKDIINLGELASRLQPFQTAVLRMELDSPEQVISEILHALERRCGCTF
jgi:tetraacyldisaccharide 4'-kinase